MIIALAIPRSTWTAAFDLIWRPILAFWAKWTDVHFRLSERQGSDVHFRLSAVRKLEVTSDPERPADAVPCHSRDASLPLNNADPDSDDEFPDNDDNDEEEDYTDDDEIPNPVTHASRVPQSRLSAEDSSKAEIRHSSPTAKTDEIPSPPEKSEIRNPKSEIDFPHDPIIIKHPHFTHNPRATAAQAMREADIIWQYLQHVLQQQLNANISGTADLGTPPKPNGDGGPIPPSPQSACAPKPPAESSGLSAEDSSKAEKSEIQNPKSEIPTPLIAHTPAHLNTLTLSLKRIQTTRHRILKAAADPRNANRFLDPQQRAELTALSPQDQAALDRIIAAIPATPGFRPDPNATIAQAMRQCDALWQYLQTAIAPLATQILTGDPVPRHSSGASIAVNNEGAAVLSGDPNPWFTDLQINTAVQSEIRNPKSQISNLTAHLHTLITAHWRITAARQQAHQIISTQPDDYDYDNDPEILAALEALRALGIEPPDDDDY